MAAMKWQDCAGLLRQLRKAGGRRAHGATVAEGWRLIERALAAGQPITFVLMSERAMSKPTTDEARVVQRLAKTGVPTIAAPDATIRELTGGRSFGDLLALLPIDARGLESVLRQASGRSVLVGYDVLDPGNLGALTRTAHALGAAAVIWVRGTHPMHPKALRSSMGSCFRVPWVHVSLPCDEVVGLLGAGGWRNVATLTKRSQPLPDRITGPCAVWMGSEAHGLPEDAAWDLRVRIPMAPDIDSLSVNAAAAIVMSRVGHAAVT